MAESVLFHMMSFVALFAAFFVVLARQPIVSVLSLIVVFFNGAGLLILLDAEFLGVLLIIVYVGAIAVLFLFMVMMVGGADSSAVPRGGRFHGMPLAVFVAFCVVFRIGSVWRVVCPSG